jgi:hypothetical protein
MPVSQKKALAAHRRRKKRRGITRLEIHVRKDDAALLRGIARALADPAREADARALLRKRFSAAPAKGLKALLASAPLDGIDLARDRDGERNVAL